MRVLPLLAALVHFAAAQSGSLQIPTDPKPDREPEFDNIVPAGEPEKEEPQPQSEILVPEKPADDGVLVSILGYHEFSNDKPNTAMRIQTSKFRKQMEALKNLAYPVISMDKFMAWKRGESTLPPQCFLITIDDGWKSVYTDAWPILKELEFPFTLFLYKNYVDGGGRALTSDMIQEMLASGLCTIGSHSVSHPLPSKFRRTLKKGEEAYQSFLHTEFGESKKFLEKKFGNPIHTYAYPGGYVTEDMRPFAKEYGYDFLFTVNPGMTRLDSDNHLLPRYIILGNHDPIFELATTFRNMGSQTPSGVTIQTTPHPVLPQPGALIPERLPLIATDMSEIPTIEPESLVMRVAGFGKVPAVWDEEKKTFSWQVNRPLRVPVCQVSVQWKLMENREYELPMRWSFRIDLEAAYQPQ